jgi:hypothetical protein
MKERLADKLSDCVDLILEEFSPALSEWLQKRGIGTIPTDEEIKAAFVDMSVSKSSLSGGSGNGSSKDKKHEYSEATKNLMRSWLSPDFDDNWNRSGCHEYKKVTAATVEKDGDKAFVFCGKGSALFCSTHDKPSKKSNKKLKDDLSLNKTSSDQFHVDVVKARIKLACAVLGITEPSMSDVLVDVPRGRPYRGNIGGHYQVSHGDAVWWMPKGKLLGYIAIKKASDSSIHVIGRSNNPEAPLEPIPERTAMEATAFLKEWIAQIESLKAKSASFINQQMKSNNSQTFGGNGGPSTASGYFTGGNGNAFNPPSFGGTPGFSSGGAFPSSAPAPSNQGFSGTPNFGGFSAPNPNQGFSSSAPNPNQGFSSSAPNPNQGFSSKAPNPNQVL